MHKDISICVKLTSIKLLECFLFIEPSDKTLNTIFNWANNVLATLFIVSGCPAGYPETWFKSKIQSGIRCHPHLQMPDDYVIPNLQVFCQISRQISSKMWYICVMPYLKIFAISQISTYLSPRLDLFQFSTCYAHAEVNK